MRYRQRTSLALAFSLLIGLANTALGGEFAPAKNLAVGFTPVSVRAADLDHNGTVDLVVANLCGDADCLAPGTVTVLLGNGDGSFGSAADYPMGSFAASVAIEDLNADGILDVAVANAGFGGGVTVLLGNGDGTFQAALDSDEGLAPSRLAAGDFDGDGRPDLAVIGGAGCVPPFSPISVLLGNGDATFREPITTCAGIGTSAIAVADLNGDGKLDLVTANWNQGDGANISVLLGNGDGSLQSSTEYAADSPASVALADFNGDGKIDVAVGDATGQAESSHVSLFLGNGDGTLQPAAAYGKGVMTGIALIAADVNNDGLLDIVGGGASGVGVLLGKGDGTFYGGSGYVSKFSNSIATGDVNGDGNLDIAQASASNNAVGVLLNNGNAPIASLSSDALRFGGIHVGETSPPQKVTLTNIGYSRLTFSSFTITGDFLMKHDCGEGLDIQASCTLTVQFRPRAPGIRTGRITILDNGKPPQQSIRLRGGGI